MAGTHVETLKDLVTSGILTYGVVAVTLSRRTNTHHIEGYLEFKETQRMIDVKKLIKMLNVKLEERRGSREQARAFIMNTEDELIGETVEVGRWKETSEHKDDKKKPVIIEFNENEEEKVHTHTITYVGGRE